MGDDSGSSQSQPDVLAQALASAITLPAPLTPHRLCLSSRQVPDLAGELAVQGLPGAERRDAQAAGRSALVARFHGDRIARRVEDGPAARASAVTGA